MPDGVSEDVSKEKLEDELQGIEDAIRDLDERVSDLEDKDMMAELETLSIEEEVQEVEEMLNHMDKEELERRLNMVEQIQEEYQEGKVHEKLEYLYEQIKKIRNGMDEETESGQEEQSNDKLDRIESKVEKLEQKVQQLENMNQGEEKGEDTALAELIEDSSRFETQNTSEGEKVKLK